MTRNDRLAQLERDIAVQRDLVAEAVARLRGLEAERDSLRAGTRLSGRLSDLDRAAAIVAVLRDAASTLTPTEILERLRHGGRDDDMRSLTATLSYLVKRGAVQRPERGRYLAA